MARFVPDAQKREYYNLAQIERDFAQMAANGINTVRIPHTMPPHSLLDLAHEHGLRVMVGLVRPNGSELCFHLRRNVLDMVHVS